MRAIVLATTPVLFLSLLSTARAEPLKTAAAPSGPQAVVYDAHSAFAFLKTLGSDWVRASDDPATTSPVVNFRVTAGGSAVLETIYIGPGTDMLTVYHMDGDNLLLTHYCVMMNAPVLQFEPSATPGEIKFTFAGGTNFDPNVDAHLHEGGFRITDADTLQPIFVTFTNGKQNPVPPGRNPVLVRKP
jgi:hypothetical protein